ncbi:hypothetical protein [Falsiphaeobacter marinintestinus]|uniref:hypothetical protein n=1 Tax=Falsiphaeobacter marinintestinus TaxID=1492905 RepID=UPI0011B623D9|nr:hypothetical protein [Phaeobacter marinintestinus]
MSLRRFALATVLAVATPVAASAQSTENAQPTLYLELNAVRDVGAACRLTFLARNGTGATIEQAVFETVIFDVSGGVVNLSLFDFRDLPADRMRVREFELSGMPCDTVGQVLINGANSCLVDGAESGTCDQALSLSSRLDVELLG